MPIISTWAPFHWCLAVDGKSLTIHFCSCVISNCRKHKHSHSGAIVCFWRNLVWTMWPSSLSVTTSSKTVSAYFVTRLINHCKNLLTTSTAWWLSSYPIVLFPLPVQILLEWFNQHAKVVQRYKVPVVVFRKFSECSFPAAYGESLSTQYDYDIHAECMIPCGEWYLWQHNRVFLSDVVN